ncbi:MAG TPA: hypothetical protein VMR45_03240, partial [Patescibacteria group bacterium]|nr:hypothetical protein [Patescibacteria group bacterium]
MSNEVEWKLFYPKITGFKVERRYFPVADFYIVHARFNYIDTGHVPFHMFGIQEYVEKPTFWQRLFGA